jgi:hypothetical protein
VAFPPNKFDNIASKLALEERFAFFWTFGRYARIQRISSSKLLGSVQLPFSLRNYTNSTLSKIKAGWDILSPTYNCDNSQIVSFLIGIIA